VLAATGIHGLVAYAVSRRRREIGIRIAIGASAGNVLRVVLGRIALLLGIGAAAGLLLAVAAGQLLSTIVYQASPRDPLTLAIVAAIIVAVGATAAWMPARRSLTTHPMDALRPE
jgi:ABC-type antimicrobial peptide transport system permease subunit